MGVTSHTFEHFVCDRCDASEDIPSGQLTQRAQWGYVEGQRYQGGALFNGYKLTLCPKCCDDIAAWSMLGGDHG